MERWIIGSIWLNRWYNLERGWFVVWIRRVKKDWGEWRIKIEGDKDWRRVKRSSWKIGFKWKRIWETQTLGGRTK